MEENGLHGGGGGGGDDEQLELGLGLSLGSSSGLNLKAKATPGNGRILTAKDFPNGFSSSSLAAPNWSTGTKRERASSPPNSSTSNKNGSASAVSQVVGWPPIRSYRMNTMFNQSTKTSNAEEGKGVGGNENNDNSNKKINHGTEKNESAVKEQRGSLGFVKVNMDGLPIGRKVDLGAHKNYETLAKMLIEMFFKQSTGTCGGKEQEVQVPELLDGSSDFALTYEDKEGDWMLVGDVPWGMFLNTVKRLRIMRTSEANGLAPKFQDRNEKQKCRPI